MAKLFRSDKMTQFRGFIAVDIGAYPKIIDYENEIKKSGAIIKLVEPENIHVTLKFLGDTEEKLIDDIERIMINSIKNIEPFQIQLKGSGVFPNQNYMKVMWIGIKNGEKIGQIANSIDENISSLGFEKEKRSFSPHLTIARIKAVKNKEKLIQIIEKYQETVFADIQVISIKLKQSQLTPKGPIYTTLKEVKL